MKVLVTGGAGFIGSHLVDWLTSQPHQVVVLDDFSTGYLANLEKSVSTGNCKVVRGSVVDSDLLRTALDGCNAAVHLAAIAAVPDTIRDPVGSNAINLTATLGLLEACRQQKLQRYVFASSAAVYGDASEPPQREDMPVSPLSPYALQKQAGERYGQIYHQLYGLPTVGLRFFNVFGERQRPDSAYSGVISRFVDALDQGRQPTIFGDGLQSRDFVHVANVVSAIGSVLTAEPANVAGQVFNVGGGESVTLLDLLNELAKLKNIQVQPRLEPARLGDVRHSRADTARLQKAVAFKASVSWREGLRRMVSGGSPSPSPL